MVKPTPAQRKVLEDLNKPGFSAQYSTFKGYSDGMLESVWIQQPDEYPYTSYSLNLNIWRAIKKRGWVEVVRKDYNDNDIYMLSESGKAALTNEKAPAYR